MHVRGALAILAVTLPQPSSAQAIKIALNVTEKTEGLFESAFGSAFRSLGDVSIVTSAENPDYLLRIVVLCSPSGEECREAKSYSISLSLSQPLEEGYLKDSHESSGLDYHPSCKRDDVEASPGL